MKYFFSFGYPKSGTTYLQMLLNSHPDLSCPAEHQLFILFEGLTKLFTDYNKQIHSINQRMTKKDLALFKNDDIDSLAKHLIELALKRGSLSKAVKLYGLKDNSILQWLQLYTHFFPKEKYIMIVRDPRNIGISQWNRSLRKDKNLIKGNNIDDYTTKVINKWARNMNNVNKIIDKNPDKFFICKYENLNKKNDELKKIFKFLSVSYNNEIIQKILNSNSIDKFKNNKFFGKGFFTNWKEELKPTINEKIINTHGNLLKKYGYLD